MNWKCVQVYDWTKICVLKMVSLKYNILCMVAHKVYIVNKYSNVYEQIFWKCPNISYILKVRTKQDWSQSLHCA